MNKIQIRKKRIQIKKERVAILQQIDELQSLLDTEKSKRERRKIRNKIVLLGKTLEKTVMNPIEDKKHKGTRNWKIKIDSFNIRKNERFYEIENDELHEVFKSVDKCYTFISSKI
ncbi:hypothetical protein [Ureibacillus thermosphaericus]|uniref:Uncharacterized protein n=1 Tax=Ureibacillus thermosphaericus TaxID=51173 RepID=A0A840PS37_URETH|nr:hypothetical protein [Ureibacillus thermosphaericus]MBB5148637.1 hypothetical protein [Ureibacillus thermosphaericus]NKZ31352.1 hypothetical protein [Ureibacillus thermosphaericus]